jgi:Spy/CpxP family protein refolding chaperone
MQKFKLALAATMLVGLTSIASAQDPQPAAPQGQGGRPSPQQMMERMMAGITLSAAQKTQVDSVMKTYGDQMMALRQDQSLDQDARRAKGRELRGKQNDAIKAILTDDQKKIFEKNQADMQQGGGRPPQA